MRYAVSVPNLDVYSDPRLMAELAHEAEEAGWDGFFTWDQLLYSTAEVLPVGGFWTSLAAAAVATDRIRIGAMAIALPRRRPWLVAREAVALDHLSGGRLILGVNLGSSRKRTSVRSARRPTTGCAPRSSTRGWKS